MHVVQSLPPTEKYLTLSKGIVYKVDCLECDFVYYGQTERSMKTRKGRDIGSNQPASKIAKHASECGHEFDFDNMAIVDIEGNDHNRLFLEG